MEDDKLKEYRIRFSKWQMKTLEERGEFISLLLSLSLATIAFVVHQLLQSDFEFKSDSQKWGTYAGVILLLVSVILALWISLNRLKDTRETTNILKSRKDNDPQSVIDDLVSKNKETGKYTITAVNWLVWLFGIGETLSITALILHFTN